MWSLIISVKHHPLSVTIPSHVHLVFPDACIAEQETEPRNSSAPLSTIPSLHHYPSPWMLMFLQLFSHMSETRDAVFLPLPPP